MDDGAVLDTAQSWLGEGRSVALATVVETWGSAPRPVGSHLAVTEDGTFAGSVSGGCVEGAVVSEAVEILRNEGPARVLGYGVSDRDAWGVGLVCGGTIRIFLLRPDPRLIGDLQASRRRRIPVAVVSDIGSGRQTLLGAEHLSGGLALSDGQVKAARQLLTEDRSGFAAEEVFVRSYDPPWTLYIVGAVHIAQALIPMAELAGFEVCLIDPRQAFATEARFPKTRIVAGWPDKVLADVPLDAHAAVVVLNHDPKIDDPALASALKTSAFYIGALGSRRNHERRLQRLAEAGFSDDQLVRVAGPVGLDLGGRSTGEIAVSIIAEIVGARYGRRREELR